MVWQQNMIVNQMQDGHNITDFEHFSLYLCILFSEKQTSQKMIYFDDGVLHLWWCLAHIAGITTVYHTYPLILSQNVNHIVILICAVRSLGLYRF